MSDHRHQLPKCSILDIDDAEGFVRDMVYRKLRKLDKYEIEDMVAEGLMLLVALSRRYDPSKDTPNRKPGHRCKGPRCCVPSFAGYASYLLPNKLLDAWHASHEDHLLRTQPDGSRKYFYHQETCSLDDGSRKNYGPETPGFSHGGVHDDDYSTTDAPSTRHVGNFIPVPLIKRT